MTRRTKDFFASITTEGTLLPPDLLQRIATEDLDLGGLTAADYHLSGERLREAITRSWNRLLAAWRHFETARAALADGDLGTSITRERWLLPLFQELGYGRLEGSGGFQIEGKRFAVSHLWRHVPIHLVGCKVDLDRHAAGVAGAARASPHGLMQELLNRRDDLLWGIVANGLRLRVLRDSRALTRQAYLEFDLESMLRGERYADFALLWLIVHESRVEADKPSACWLEKWTQAAAAQGTRALEQLRDGVTKAIEALGRGFLAHAGGEGNRVLRAQLESGAFPAQDYYRELLRLVYRLLFLFVAEDRGLLLDPAAPDDAKERFRRWYSTTRLRQRAERRRGGAHVDLWHGLRVVMSHLAEGRAELSLPALGSFLWSRDALPNLLSADVANRDLLDAVRALAFTADGGGLRAVDWKNLGSEELGSVYESLLELHPRIENGFTLATAGGNERKTTGSYYTPSSLVECLLDSALDPVLNEAAKKPNPEEEILALKVCDPACGSGHFLIAAAHRIARRLASVRTGDDEPSPEATRHALRDVIGRCLYGVDLNPMAVELCKVSLWMEALEPGRPLSFLDHRIQCGNSLLGTTPALLAKGIPDEAFEPIEGDEKEFARALKKQNRDERKKKASVLPFAGTLAEPEVPYGTLGASVTALGTVDDLTLASVRRKEERWRRLTASPEYATTRLLADAWCAAFVWRKTRHAKAPLTQAVFEQLRRDPEKASADVRLEVARLTDQYRFFHWHVAFPDVFRVPTAGEGAPESATLGWSGGFDVVLGNPPWERIKLQEKEFFAQRMPEIANARNASERGKLIEQLRATDPLMLAEFADASRAAEGESHLVLDSGRFPLCGRGDVNTYTLFAEGKRQLLAPTGRMGAIVPSGIATDDTTKYFFRDLIETRSLVSLHSFNEIRALFIDTDSRNPFCLLTLTGLARPVVGGADFVYFADVVSDLAERSRHFTLMSEDIALLNPNTRTCPVFRSRRDAELTKAIYRRVPILIAEGQPEQNPWGVSFARLFDMSTASGLFRTREQLTDDGFRLDGNIFRRDGSQYLPLYEAKMVHHFDHRSGDYAMKVEGSKGLELPDVPVERLQDPAYCVLPRYWVPAAEVDARLNDRWSRSWLLGWRDICRSTDSRTVISTVIPAVGVGDKFLLMFPGRTAVDSAALLGLLDSFVFDFAARQKIGGTSLKYFTMKQLPVLPPEILRTAAPWLIGADVRGSGTPSRPGSPKVAARDWLLPRMLELTYTAHDLTPFARDCGYDGPPFRWDEERRFLLRCELDAAFFHLYLGTPEDWSSQPAALKSDLPTPRAAVAHILDTFPIVRRHDEARLRTYRTKNSILANYDEMAEAMTNGKPYVTRLDPPPADPRCAHSIPQADRAHQ